jgi:uncharacterized coiled-coil protein SlyX
VIYPELVVRDKERQPGVRYPVLPAMLLNELQRQERRLQAQDAKLAAQQQEIDELRAQVRALIGDGRPSESKRALSAHHGLRGAVSRRGRPGGPKSFDPSAARPSPSGRRERSLPLHPVVARTVVPEDLAFALVGDR